MEYKTQRELIHDFESKLSNYVSELTGQKIESAQTLLAMRTKQDDMCILTQGAPDNTIMLALGVIRQVYETQVDHDSISYEAFAEQICKRLLFMDDVMDVSQDMFIYQNPS